MWNRVSDLVAAPRGGSRSGGRRVEDPSTHTNRIYSVSEQLHSAGGTCAFKNPDTR